MFGRFCEEKTKDSYTASFENSPFDCKKSGTLIMPELDVDFSNMYDFGILFSDGTVAQSTDARYYKNPEYEMVTMNTSGCLPLMRAYAIVMAFFRPGSWLKEILVRMRFLCFSRHIEKTLTMWSIPLRWFSVNRVGL